MSQRPCPHCNGTGSIEEHFGHRLKELRTKHKLRQDEIAAAVQLSRAQIANIESGRSQPTPAMLRALALAYNVSADWLLGLV